MLLQPSQKPQHIQGAGDALVQPDVAPKLERLLNILLLFAALHFLLQTALYFSCLFFILPMSVAISSVISGADIIMATTSSDHLQVGHHVGQGAGENAQRTAFLPYIQGTEDILISMAIAYFLVRAGLIFCNLIFILPLIFFLKDLSCS